MGYSREIKRKAAQTLSERRLDAEYKADKLKQHIFSTVPEAEEYERKIASCGINAARTIVKGGDVKEKLESLKTLSLRLQREQEELLNLHGYTRDDFRPKYHCQKCSDKGFYEYENRTLMCDCLKKAMVDAAREELNRNSPLTLSTFEDFDLKYYAMDIDEGFPRSAYDQKSLYLTQQKHRQSSNCYSNSQECLHAHPALLRPRPDDAKRQNSDNSISVV